MKKYTQKEFDNFEIVNGIKHCPTGDYTNVRCWFSEGCSFSGLCSFGERCSFSGECSFSELCSFGRLCKILTHVVKHRTIKSISGLGNSKRTLYLWDTEDGVYCQAGCFFDTLEAFEKAVTAKYGSSHAYIKAAKFLLAI